MIGCELCSNDADLLIVLPIRSNEYSPTTEACLECVKKNPAFCKIHFQPHIKYKDDTTACRPCLDDSVEKNWEYVASRAAVSLLQSPRAEQGITDLKIWAKPLITEQYPFGKLVARLVIAQHLRTGLPISSVVDNLSQEGAEIILPPGFALRSSLRRLAN